MKKQAKQVVSQLWTKGGNGFSKLCFKPEGRRSIPDEVSGFFNFPNPSSRAVALESTQHLTEMSTRNLHGGKERPTGA
jgi:hypothetical protein